jgi:hypothetical protein
MGFGIWDFIQSCPPSNPDLTNPEAPVFSVMTDMKGLTSVQQKFILHWGEMGTRWGINRTVAQIHALLYLSKAPLNADDLVNALGVARSNVSECL